MTIFWVVAAMFIGGALLLVVPGLLWPRPVVWSAAAANLAVHRDQLREAEVDLAAGLIGPERFEQAVAEIQRRTLDDAAGSATAAVTPAPARHTALALALLLPVAVVLTYLQLGRPEATAPQLVAAAPAAASGQQHSLTPEQIQQRASALALALLLPVAVVLTYLQLGRPEATAPQLVAAAPAAATGQQHSLTPEQIQQRASALAERLKAEPGNAEGWQMLARSYTALGRFGDAAMALRRAVALQPPSANRLADLADLTGMAQGKRLAGEPARLIQQALDLDPKHVKSLALAGSVAFEARDYGAARDYWTRVLAVVPAESDLARSMQTNIRQATALESGATGMAAAAPTTAGPAAVPGAAPAAAPAAATPAATAVSGQVVLAPALVSRLAPGDTLFVFARAEQGPRMPLAIIKRPADGRPFEFTLDDSMAMAPNLRLSGFAKVTVGARISRSGQATPQAGDLVGQSAAVGPGARGVRVLIDQVQP